MTVMAHVRRFFEEERSTTNLVHHMGYRSLYTHMRQQFFNIPRDSLRKVYNEVHPDAIAHRRARADRKRSGWTVPGPNYIWSVDGYCKLEYFGIEIYAGIDAYSRYITWFYIGASARTARNVLAQYVTVLRAYGFMPLALRSDYGVETTLLAGAHYLLSSEADSLRQRKNRREVTRAQPPQSMDPALDRFPKNEGGDGGDGDDEASNRERLEFEDCYIYGDGTKNVRIERWWSELCKGRSMFWRVSYITFSFF